MKIYRFCKSIGFLENYKAVGQRTTHKFRIIINMDNKPAYQNHDMRKKFILIVFGIFIFCGLILCLLNKSELFQKSRLTPEINIPPLEIAFVPFGTENVIGFMNPDGSNPTYRNVKILADVFYEGSPIKKKENWLNWLLTWSQNGDYLGIAQQVENYYSPAGNPVLISINGNFIFCPPNKSPIIDTHYWIVDNTKIVIVQQKSGNEKYNRLVLYDMSLCQEKQTLFETTDTIREIAVSPSEWLAIGLVGNSRNGRRIQVYSSNHKLQFEFNGNGQEAWSKDSEWLAYLDETAKPGTLSITKNDGSNLEMITTANSGISWSPDGNWILFERNGDIIKVNIHTKEEVKIGRGSHPEWRWNIPEK